MRGRFVNVSTHLQESRSSDNSRISDRSIAIIEQQVGLAVNTTRDSNLEVHPIALLRQNSPLRPSSSHKRGIEMRIRVSWLEHGVGRAEANELARGDGPSSADLQLREGLDIERRVARRAGDEEARGHGVDLVGRERVVLGLRVRRQRERGTDVRRVPRFDRQDTPSSSKIVLVHDLPRRTQVSRDTDPLEDLRCRHERGNAGNAKGVGALLHRRGASGFQRGCEELDVVGFLKGDGFDVVVEGGVEAGRGEGGFGEVGQALAVEGVFEVFEGEGVVDDVDCAVSSVRLTESGGLGSGLPSLICASDCLLLMRKKREKGKAEPVAARARMALVATSFIVASVCTFVRIGKDCDQITMILEIVILWRKQRATERDLGCDRTKRYWKTIRRADLIQDRRVRVVASTECIIEPQADLLVAVL